MPIRPKLFNHLGGRSLIDSLKPYWAPAVCGSGLTSL